MARADRRRVRSAGSHAVSDARRRERERAAVEDTLFFSRLRGHAKWMFVFLALVFGLGFVIFGIGANQNASVGDLLRGSGGATSNGVSVSDARKRVEANPKSAQARRDLATALQQDGQIDAAEVALKGYLALKPKDQEALRELAGLYLGRGSAEAQVAQQAQLRASYLTFGSTFSEPLQLGGGKTLQPDPIEQAVSTEANQAVSTAYAAAQKSFQQAEATYEKLVAAAPNDPNVQLELAQAAQQSGNYARAITAYQRFLKLAPDDPNASIVKDQIKRLKAAQTPAPSG